MVAAKRKLKALGDAPYVPTDQAVGVVAGFGHGLVEDVDVLVKLANGYVFEGCERTAMCVRNADGSVLLSSFCSS